MSGRLAVARLLAALAALALAGCDRLPDAEQARLCRMAAPALHPEGSRIRIEHERGRNAGRGIDVAYEVTEPGRATRRATLACDFAGSALEPGRREMTGVALDGAALSEVRFYVLKRWWVDAGGGGYDPGEASARLPLVAGEAPFPAAYALQQVLNALPVCGIYALLAVAYALVYGLIGRIVLAFGELALIGAATAAMAFAVAGVLGLASAGAALAVALAVAMAAGALHGAVGARLVVRPLARASGQAMLVATLGAAIMLGEYLRLAQGARELWLTPLGGLPLPLVAAGSFMVTATPMQLMVAALTLATGAAGSLVMRFSRFGRAWRACADDARMAELLGVDPAAVLTRTLALGGALAGIAGFIIVAHYGGIGFGAGLTIGLKALVAAVFGGIGSPAGAFLGGIVIGLVETFWSAYLDGSWRDAGVLSLLIVVLIMRPGGLFGYAALRPREV